VPATAEAALQKRVSWERSHAPPSTPDASAAASPSNLPGTPPTPADSTSGTKLSRRGSSERRGSSLSVKPSFPKAAIAEGGSHAELRAGLRFSEPTSDDESSAVHVRLGLGINTGAGIKDGSVGFKLLGSGLQVGQRTGVSFLDNELMIDFGKLFGNGKSEPSEAERQSLAFNGNLDNVD